MNEEQYMAEASTFYKVWIGDFKAAFGTQVSANDRAHQWGHFHNVYIAGCTLNYRSGNRFTKAAIFLVAHLHDLFAWSRINHHELSHQFVVGTDHPLVGKLLEIAQSLSGNTMSEVRHEVAVACLEHRASFEGEFSSEFSALMNAADNELPKGLEPMLRRAYQYSLGQGLTHEAAVASSVAHMSEKFGRNGYARLPEIYVEHFQRELEALYVEIDALTVGSEMARRLGQVCVLNPQIP